MSSTAHAVNRRGVRILVIVACAGLTLSSCSGIVERKQRADRVIASVDEAIRAGTARLTVSQRIELRLGDGQAQVAGGLGGGGFVPEVTLSAEADFGRDRVAYLASLASGEPPEPVAIYAGTTVYQRKLAPSAATARPWVRLDFTSIDPDDIDDSDIEVADAAERMMATQAINNPLFLLRLLRGALSGSTQERGTESVGGVTTTHYTFNIDRLKAVDDEDEDVQDAYEALFKSVFATAVVLPGEAWLDADGVPRRFTVTLGSSVRRRDIADVHLTVELSDIGQPVTIELPGADETVKVEDVVSLAQAVTGGA